MNRPHISVVIPTFNRRETLLDALSSIKQQGLRGFECIVVDNGPSTDGTAAAVAEIAESDERFRLVQAGPIGIFPSVNLGFTVSRADIVLVMDDDVELVDAGTLSYVLECFSACAEVGVLGLSEFYPGGRHAGHQPVSGARGWLTSLRDTRLYPAGRLNRWGMIGTKFHQLPFGRALQVDHVRSSAMAVRRAAFDLAGGFYAPYGVHGGYRCETDFCFQVRRSGYVVMFSARSPQVLHKQAARVTGADRGGSDRAYLVDTGCNNTFFFLSNFWTRWSAPLFLAWDMLVGNTSQPGAVRLLKAGHWRPSVHWHAVTGKWLGMKMFWQYGRAMSR